jgi:dihydrofolate synthase / folylpolyglutamate synthase
MKVTALKTPMIGIGQELRPIINKAIRDKFENGLPERSVLVITSKIIAYEQGRLVPTLAAQTGKEVSREEERALKHQLVRQEADYYLEPYSSKYDLMLTITNATLMINAGIDESNADEHYVLWPKNLYAEAEKIWQNLREDFSVKEVGVIIPDSRSVPLRWGVVGMSLASCGFQVLNDFVGDEDLFGREIKMVQVNAAEALATAAVFEMGEVAEQTPLALVTDSKMIRFMDRPLNKQELAELEIEIKDDMYGPLLTSVDWQKGKNNA